MCVKTVYCILIHNQYKTEYCFNIFIFSLSKQFYAKTCYRKSGLERIPYLPYDGVCTTEHTEFQMVTVQMYEKKP